MRRKQLLNVMEQTGDADYADLVAEIVGNLILNVEFRIHLNDASTS